MTGRRHENKPRLKVMTINIRSLRGKKAVLEHMIDEKDPHVVCIQETRMKTPYQKYQRLCRKNKYFTRN